MVKQSSAYYKEFCVLYHEMRKEQYYYRYVFEKFWSEFSYWRFLNEFGYQESSFRNILWVFLRATRCISYPLYCQVLDLFAEQMSHVHGIPRHCFYDKVVKDFKAEYLKMSPTHCPEYHEPTNWFPRFWQTDY